MYYDNQLISNREKNHTGRGRNTERRLTFVVDQSFLPCFIYFAYSFLNRHLAFRESCSHLFPPKSNSLMFFFTDKDLEKKLYTLIHI